MSADTPPEPPKITVDNILEYAKRLRRHTRATLRMTNEALGDPNDVSSDTESGAATSPEADNEASSDVEGDPNNMDAPEQASDDDGELDGPADGHADRSPSPVRPPLTIKLRRPQPSSESQSLKRERSTAENGDACTRGNPQASKDSRIKPMLGSRTADGELECDTGKLTDGKQRAVDSPREADRDDEAGVEQPRRKRGRPSKEGSDSSAAVSPTTFCASIFVRVQGELVLVKGKTKRGDKYTAPDPIMLGPSQFTHETATWDQFLNLVAHIVQTVPKYLVVHSMTWQWLNSSSKNSALPLTSAEGLHTMINEILARKPGSPGVIVVGMSTPQVPTKTSVPKLSWALTNTSDDETHTVTAMTPSSGKENFTGTLAPQSPSGGRYDMKLTLDKKLEPIIDDLQTRYPVGRCDLHPTIACFFHAPSGHHFELKRPVLQAWANHIIKGQTDATKLPFGFKFFQPADALKTSAHLSNSAIPGSGTTQANDGIPPALMPPTLTPSVPYGLYGHPPHFFPAAAYQPPMPAPPPLGTNIYGPPGAPIWAPQMPVYYGHAYPMQALAYPGVQPSQQPAPGHAQPHAGQPNNIYPS